ncbi:MAG: hypothetical protein AAGI14_03775 [Pseudomonadota bacterium]
MTFLYKIIVALVLIWAASAFEAAAQSPDGSGPEINGDTNIAVNAEDINTSAEGGVAIARIGSITGNTEINGDTNIAVNAEEISTVAEDGVAVTGIGSINNADITGNTNIAVNAESVSTRAKDGCAETQIGSITNNTC